MRSWFDSAALSVNVLDVLLAMVVSLILILIITEVYKITHRSATYSQQFLITLVIMAVSTSVIMLIIGSNIARAFSLVGALSVIRFRNPLKESRDIGYVFIAMVIGMSAGTAFYLPGTLFTLFISGVLLTLHYRSYGTKFGTNHLLRVEVPKEVDERKLEQRLADHFHKVTLINQTISHGEDRTRTNLYVVVPKNNVDPTELKEMLAALEKEFSIRRYSVAAEPSMTSL